jgi:superfamily I DNA/RNA helicase
VRAEKILRKDKKHREGFFYDALIIDEGQDFTSEWVDSLISLLQNEEKGIVRFFYDPAQRLYGRRNGIDNPQVLSMPVMVLARGLRNTKKILEWVYKKTRFSLPCYSNMIQGPNVRELSYKDSVELERKLINYYEELVAKYKLLPSDILVVSLRSRKNSALKNLNDDRFVWNDVGRKCLVRDKVNIVSGHRIKGLDAMAVILVDAEEPESISDRTDWKRRLLVGATRAKKILCVFSKT